MWKRQQFLWLALACILVVSFLKQVSFPQVDWDESAVVKQVQQHQDAGQDSTFHFNEPIESNSTGNLWEQSTILPPWMKDYFTWHKVTYAQLNETNWDKHQYLIMRCFEEDAKCGGTSDRLQSTPFMILLAHRTQRLLMIKWERPYKLEYFLRSPKGGMNWSVPDWLDDKLMSVNMGGPIGGHMERHFLPDPRRAISTIYQSNSHGSNYYDERRAYQIVNTTLANKTVIRDILYTEPSFEEVYRDVWNVLYEPVPPIAALIQSNMQQLGLQRDQYTALHFRTLYVRDESENRVLIQKALRCAVKLQANKTIYVASDSKNVTALAIEFGQQQEHVVAGRLDTPEPLHLDRGGDFLTLAESRKVFPPEAFYDTFVDLYLMAGANCIAHGRGGYGRWANLLSSHPNCTVNYLRDSC